VDELPGPTVFPHMSSSLTLLPVDANDTFSITNYCLGNKLLSMEKPHIVQHCTNNKKA